MTGHLLVEPKMTSSANEVPNRRLTTVNEPTEGSHHPFDYYDDVDRHQPAIIAPRNGPGRGDSTSSLEQYFDQQFHSFPMANLPAVDWSLRSDDRLITSSNFEV